MLTFSVIIIVIISVILEERKYLGRLFVIDT